MENEGTKILIIEDNDIFRDMISLKIKDAGYTTAFLRSNATVEEIKKEQAWLLLINIVSPKEKGLQLIKEIREDSGIAEIPIIAIAKTEGSVLARHAQKHGVKYFVDRVIFDADELLEKVALLINGEEDKNKKNGEEEVPQKVENFTEGDVGEFGHVLLIEDDSFMRNMFAQSLRDAGFSVDAALDALVGEEMLKKHVPDVILLDLLLPGKSGFEFLAEIKRKTEYLSIPVIVVSNLGGKGDIDRALDLGAADFLVKANSTIDEIIAKAKAQVEKSKKEPILPKSIM